MRHTNDEIEQAGRRFEELADGLDPDTVRSDNTEDLTQIAAASATVRADEDRLRQAVDAARARGRSWNQIGIALGVSRQAARQRFTVKTLREPTSPGGGLGASRVAGARAPL